MRIVAKKVNPGLDPADAFMAQRAKESGSTRLRNAVKAMLSNGGAHTTTVAKVFKLLIETDKDRFGPATVKTVLKDFDVE